MSVIIAVAGGSGSGKTTFSRQLHQKIGESESCLILQDSYYIDQSDKFDHDGGSINFDHPDAIEFSLLATQLKELKQGQPIDIPVYEFSTHKRIQTHSPQAPRKIIIVEGILIFHHQYCCDLFDHKIFVDTPEEVRFSRRLKRDMEERGRTRNGVYQQFFNQVKPMHDEFVEPSKLRADLVISGEEPYDEFIVDLLKNLIR